VTPSARLASAIEVLTDIAARRRPAPDALKDWGLAHRFAGSKDRAAIAGLVYEALRRRASSAWLSRDDSARGIVLGMLRQAQGLDAQAIGLLFSGERFAPDALTGAERDRLHSATLDDAPVHVRGDFPVWIAPLLARAFGGDIVAEMQALSARAPLDIRVNTLKTTRDIARAALAHLDASETPWSPWGLRLPTGPDGRGPSLQAEPGFPQGWFEVQDEGSQIASLLAGARPGETVVDLCAGAGGKTLSLAAAMENKGRIVATDVDGRRLAPLYDRLARSGAAKVEIRSPRGRWRQGGPDPLADLAGTADLVLVDAPCTGSGTWRRNPDAKWRLRPGSLTERLKDQEIVLDRAAGLVKPGGRLAYITCSVLPEENDDAIGQFLARAPGFRRQEPAAVARDAGHDALGRWRSSGGHGLQFTPLRVGTDGFYIALMIKAP